MQFNVGATYTRSDIKKACGLSPTAKGGHWDTGVVREKGEFFIFANVGSSGRTGHDYANEWIGDDFQWFHKTDSRLDWPTVESILSGDSIVHIFWRESNSSAFSYAGRAFKKEAWDTQPVKVLWGFENEDEWGNESMVGVDHQFKEGRVRSILVNAFERDRKARQACIEHYGCSCFVCGFSFAEKYGEFGQGFIHVHHLTSISQIGSEYVVDPVRDLRPICPNCHAMIHRNKEMLSIEELVLLTNKQASVV